MALFEDLKKLKIRYENELYKNKKVQQNTIKEIRKLKRIRRRLNYICDIHEIKIDKSLHLDFIKNLKGKEKLLHNTIHKDMVFYLAEIEDKLLEKRKKFNIISNSSRRLKKDLAELNRILYG